MMNSDLLPKLWKHMPVDILASILDMRKCKCAWILVSYAIIMVIFTIIQARGATFLTPQHSTTQWYESPAHIGITWKDLKT